MSSGYPSTFHTTLTKQLLLVKGDRIVNSTISVKENIKRGYGVNRDARTLSQANSSAFHTVSS